MQTEREELPEWEQCIGYYEKDPHDDHVWPYPGGGSRWCPGRTGTATRDDDYTPETEGLNEMVDDAVGRMKRDLEVKDREAIAWLIGRMGAEMSEAEAGEEHAVLIVDPDTGTRQVVGPYPDRLHAKVACVLLKARYEQDDPELGNLTFESVIFFADPLTVP